MPILIKLFFDTRLKTCRFTRFLVEDIGLEPLIEKSYLINVKILHYITCVIDTVATVVSIYVILKKSTKEMQAYKKFLINIVVCFESFLMRLFLPGFSKLSLDMGISNRF